MISGRQIPFSDLAGVSVSTGSRFQFPKKTQVGTSPRGETQGSLPSGDGSSSRDEGNQLGTSGNLGTSRTSPCPNRAFEGEGGGENLGAFARRTAHRPLFSHAPTRFGPRDFRRIWK